MLLDIHNPKLMPSKLAAFHLDAGTQVLKTWLNDAALQYVTVKKSPTGQVGSTGVVKYTDAPPYFRIQNS